MTPSTHRLFASLARIRILPPAQLCHALIVHNGWGALLCLLGAVCLSGMEALYVQVTTTRRELSVALLHDPDTLLLLCMDVLVPLSLALLWRRVFMLYLVAQTFLSAVLLHYDSFFYNTLTLSTIYHSINGASYLGTAILAFVRVHILLGLTLLCILKILLVQMSRAPESRMPRVWRLRGVTAVLCMAIITVISSNMYGKTGLLGVWADTSGHRTALQRRTQEGTRESVRAIGYVATWLGELVSGTYRDTALIYAESRCTDPDSLCTEKKEEKSNRWNGLPLPPRGRTVVMVQVESLDYAALDMHVNGHRVTPFLASLLPDALLLKAFAPHKVGSANSDYELLNSRVADQNVMYYSYIKDYPDSVVAELSRAGYRPAAFHGMEGNLFSMKEAYQLMGFTQTFFKEDLLEAGYAKSDYIMEHVADADVFDCAANYLEQGKGNAVFVVTMTSHIPFIEPLPLFGGGNSSFSRYVASLRYLDQSLAAFYARLPEGTLFMVWGDHGSEVAYPRGFAPNRSHVPFMLHVKGHNDWLQQAVSSDAGRRTYTLCELSHYLRRILSRSAD